MRIVKIGEILPGVQIPFWENEIEEDDEIYVLGQDIAQMLNYSKSKGKITNVPKMIQLAKEEDTFKFKVNVEKEKEKYYKTHDIKFSNTIKNAKTRECWFVNLDGFFDIAMRTNSSKAQELRDIIKDILVDVEKFGIYAKRQFDKEYLAYSYKHVADTFTQCSLETLAQKYEDAIKWYTSNKYKIRSKKKYTATESKLLCIKKIEKALENRIAKMDNKTLACFIQDQLAKIKNDILEITKRSYGTKYGILNAKYNNLKNEKIDIYDCIELDIHGFTNNLMYAVKDGKLSKTTAYERWIYAFKKEIAAIELEDLKIDVEKPMELFAYYDCMEKFDTHNFTKAFIDQLSNVYGFNDKLICQEHCARNKCVDSYSDGKIYFYIRNI